MLLNERKKENLASRSVADCLMGTAPNIRLFSVSSVERNAKLSLVPLVTNVHHCLSLLLSSGPNVILSYFQRCLFLSLSQRWWCKSGVKNAVFVIAMPRENQSIKGGGWCSRSVARLDRK